MWSEDRRYRILALLAAQGRVTANTLAEMLEVSRETVRRDVLQLEAEGRLRRVHGGVVAVEAAPEMPFAARMQVHAPAKQRIAKAAARLLTPGQCCFIDAGTTTAAFAVALAKIPGITVITNSFDVANAQRSMRPDADVLLLGGQLGKDVPATYGGLTLEQIARFRPDFAIISPVGLHPERGATAYHLAEAEVARAMIAGADRLIVLADRSKIGTVSRVHLCGCAEIDTLVTEKGSHPTIKAIKNAGVRQVIQV